MRKPHACAKSLWASGERSVRGRCQCACVSRRGGACARPPSAVLGERGVGMPAAAVRMRCPAACRAAAWPLRGGRARARPGPLRGPWAARPRAPPAAAPGGGGGGWKAWRQGKACRGRFQASRAPAFPALLKRSLAFQEEEWCVPRLSHPQKVTPQPSRNNPF